MASEADRTASSEEFDIIAVNGLKKLDSDQILTSAQPIPQPEHATVSSSGAAKSSLPNAKAKAIEMADEKNAQSFASLPTEPTLDGRDSMTDSRTSPSSRSGSNVSSEDHNLMRRHPFLPVKPTLSMHSRGRSSFPHAQLHQVSTATGFSSASPRPARRPQPRPRSTSASRDSSNDHQAGLNKVWSTDVRELWIRLHDHRKDNQQLRKDMAAKRKNIRALRSRKDAADNAFMQTIRPRLTGAVPTQDMAIIRRFADMQAVRNEYNTVELEYEQLEKELDQHDISVTVLETDFFTLLLQTAGNTSRESSPAPSEDEKDVPPSRASLLGITGDRPTDLHPLYLKLLDTVGDRELARERLTDLLFRRDDIMYDMETKLKMDHVRDEQGEARYTAMSIEELHSLKMSVAQLTTNAAEVVSNLGTNIRDEDMEFLNEFERLEAEAKKQLAESSRRVDRLRDICVDKGYMRKNAPYHEEISIFPSVNAETPGIPPTHNLNLELLPKTGDSLAHPRFPILLSSPSHVLEIVTARDALRSALRLPNDNPMRASRVGEAMKEFGILTLFEQVAPEDKSDFINRWLLHRLRISPMEVEQLFSTFSSVLKPRNLRRWQEDVLYHWPRDGAANLDAMKFEGSLTANEEVHGAEDSGRVNSVIAEILQVHSEPGDEPPAHGQGSTQRSPLSLS